MTRPHADDLASLAGDVARAAVGLAEARRALRGPLAEPVCPLEAIRHVAGKRGYDALLAVTPSQASAPLRASLARWVFAFTGARLGWELELAEVRARRDPPPVGSRPAPRRAEAGVSTALAGLLSADSAGEAASFADQVRERAPSVNAARDERRERLEEVARRLGATGRFARAIVHRDAAAAVLASDPAPRRSLVVSASSDLIEVLAAELSATPRDAPDAALPGLDEDTLRRSAGRFLSASEPLTRALVRRAHHARTGRADPGRSGGVDALRLALGRDTRSADWPARLTLEWLAQRFVGLTGGAEPRGAPTLPAPLGVASFPRAAEAYGEALHRQESLRYACFALAHDPHFVDAHRTGALFAASLASPAFLARELGLGRGAAADASRALTVTLLLGARARATALLFALDGTRSESARAADGAIGGPAACLGYVAPRLDEEAPARWVAALTAHAAHAAHVDTYDEDYYRNPRAARALRARFALPALATTFVSLETEAAPDLCAHADELAAAFERELG